jgi:hypothetical protein
MLQRQLALTPWKTVSGYDITAVVTVTDNTLQYRHHRPHHGDNLEGARQRTLNTNIDPTGTITPSGSGGPRVPPPLASLRFGLARFHHPPGSSLTDVERRLQRRPT